MRIFMYHQNMPKPERDREVNRRWNIKIAPSDTNFAITKKNGINHSVEKFEKDCGKDRSSVDPLTVVRNASDRLKQGRNIAQMMTCQLAKKESQFEIMHKAEILAKTPKNAVQVALKPSVDQYSTDPAKCRYVNKGTVKADEKGYTDLLNDARSEWNRVENILQQLEKRVRSWLDTTEQEVAQHDSADPEDGDGLLHTVATDIGGHLEEAVPIDQAENDPETLLDNDDGDSEGEQVGMDS
ncbi:hypothetical protein CYMTET_21085 [Cymbomonas tetramitiformis]|uniref:Uncharacterized protein n=2 Tax=Cymbomonas tetramitiformis TaxID=36881 RepID=A0AAE0G2U8_9CHLO|nr:hypothetical protein CYMTET_21085 [Cymbomonas tetramitiformis]